MTRAEALQRLRAHEAELKALGIEQLSLFGSVARGSERADSDVDVAARLSATRSVGAFHLIRIEQRLADMLGAHVDLVTEPSDALTLQREIDRDRVHVF